MTKEKVEVVLERLRRLGLGKSDGDTIDERESTTRDHVLLGSVILVLIA